MECISCCFNHFRVIEVLDAQKNRHLKTSQSAIELKRDANLSVLLASPDSLDACYLDPKFVHLTTMARFATLLEKQTRKFGPNRLFAPNRALGGTTEITCGRCRQNAH